MKQTTKTLMAALLLLGGTFAITSTASAHEGDCPYCKLKLVQNTKDEDNEVVVKFGNKRIEYRCVYCVVADQAKLKGDLIVYAPSDKAGSPVILKRTNGTWSAPEGTLFLNTFKRHKTCAAESRTFSSKANFDKYVKAKSIEGAKALTLTEFLAEAAKKK